MGDFIKEHCGLLAAGAVLPLTIEECIANIRGTKIAKDAGVTGDLFKKVKNLHKLSAASYCLTPVFIGLSVYLASKLRDCICLLKSQAK